MDLSSNVEKILGIVTKLAVQEFWLAWGLESDLKSLETSLSSINAVIQDAEEQRATNHRLSLWLRQLKHVLYDAEDVLDDFAYEVLRKQVVNTHGGIRRKVRHYFSSSNPVVYRLKIGHRVKSIRQRLDEINSNKNEFNLAANLQADTGHVNQLKGREITHSFVNASDIIGRDADRETIVHLLMDSQGHDGDIPVIPIVGMGGLGKTALTKMIFNDQRVDDHFDSKVWVCLGDIKEFNVNQVMVNIVKSLLEEKSLDNSNPQHLQNIIRDKFQNKRFLLILDDMWDANRSSWLELKALLTCGGEGSKILITTRINSVALCAGTVSPHNLEGLPLEQCVSLFKKMAFSSEGEVDQNLMNIGVEIVRKCKGVPLAVRCLGSLLFMKSEKQEWLSVKNSDIWKIEEESQNGILHILKFSYNQLPSHLKQCFVYCSLFPEDHTFLDSSLISFWMAHGLLEPPKKKQGGQAVSTTQPEHVGKLYIKELLSRGFFQDFDTNSIVSCFKMHDLVRDLACLLGGEEFSIVNVNDQNISEAVRHVYLNAQQFSPKRSDADIQTILIHDEDFRASITFLEMCVAKFKHLKALALIDSELEELPKSIGSLKHLRCLDLWCKSLKRLPNSICKLHNLQTLSVYCEEMEELPEHVGELINLRRLEINTKQKHFPNKHGIGSLTSLQYLEIYFCPNLEIVFGEMKLLPTSLRTLIVRKCSSLISLFQLSTGMNHCLPALEVLIIEECENLSLDFGEDQQQDDDSAVVPASPSLKLPSLTSLTIAKLPKVEGFPLWIEGSANTLQYLEIKDCENLRALPEWLPNLASLRTLIFDGTPKLTRLPLGMERLTALKKLEITNCRELSYICSRGKEDEEWLKIANIPNIHSHILNKSQDAS